MARWNEYIGGEADEFGNGPGSYDIDQSVWHVNVSDPPNLSCPHSDRSQVLHLDRCYPKWLGYLQRYPGLDKLGHLWLCYLV